MEWNDKASLIEKVKAIYNVLNWNSHEMSLGRVKTNRIELQNNIERAKVPMSIAFVKMAEKGDIDEITASENIDLFLEWTTNVKYTTNTLLQYEGLLCRVIQEHTSQADWTPDTTPSLYKVLGIDENGIVFWSQPISQLDAFMLNDEVMHNDLIWVSDYDNNVWEPGVFGWHLKDLKKGYDEAEKHLKDEENDSGDAEVIEG